MTFSNGYNKLPVGYFELKLHKYILGTPETNCKIVVHLVKRGIIGAL